MVHKCIIAVRSTPFAALLRKDPSVDKLTLECEQTTDLMQPFLCWLYSASIQMPEDIFQVVELYFMAYDF